MLFVTRPFRRSPSNVQKSNFTIAYVYITLKAIRRIVLDFEYHPLYTHPAVCLSGHNSLNISLPFCLAARITLAAQVWFSWGPIYELNGGAMKVNHRKKYWRLYKWKENIYFKHTKITSGTKEISFAKCSRQRRIMVLKRGALPSSSSILVATTFSPRRIFENARSVEISRHARVDWP